MALQFYYSKRCLLPAHPVSSCQFHQALPFCILEMCEYVAFMNFQSERLWHFNLVFVDSRYLFKVLLVRSAAMFKSLPTWARTSCRNLQSHATHASKFWDLVKFETTEVFCRFVIVSEDVSPWHIVSYKDLMKWPIKARQLQSLMSDSKVFLVVWNLDRKNRPKKIETNVNQATWGLLEGQTMKPIQRKMDIHAKLPLGGSRNRTSLVSCIKLLVPSCRSYPSVATRSQKGNQNVFGTGSNHVGFSALTFQPDSKPWIGWDPIIAFYWRIKTKHASLLQQLLLKSFGCVAAICILSFLYILLSFFWTLARIHCGHNNVANEFNSLTVLTTSTMDPCLSLRFRSMTYIFSSEKQTCFGSRSFSTLLHLWWEGSAL